MTRRSGWCKNETTRKESQLHYNFVKKEHDKGKYHRKMIEFIHFSISYRTKLMAKSILISNKRTTGSIMESQKISWWEKWGKRWLNNNTITSRLFLCHLQLLVCFSHDNDDSSREGSFKRHFEILSLWLSILESRLFCFFGRGVT